MFFALQVIGTFCTKYNVHETETLVAAQSIIGDGIASVPRGVKLTDQLAKVKWICETHEKTYEQRILG